MKKKTKTYNEKKKIIFKRYSKISPFSEMCIHVLHMSVPVAVSISVDVSLPVYVSVSEDVVVFVENLFD